MPMLRNFIRQVRTDPLFRNSLLLMMSTGVMAALGFVFWSICARLYTEEQVGVATALLAVLNLITSLSLLGFEISIIRVLASHKDKNALLNACLSISGLLGVIFGIGFLVLQPIAWPDLATVRTGIVVTGLFMGFIFVSIASYMLESVFIALRSSQYILQKGFIFSVTKLVLPPVLVGFGAFGIYASWMIALMVATVVSAIVLVRRFDFRFGFHFNLEPLQGMVAYSFANYASSFAEGLPIMLLPLVILGMFGPAASAHYYMAMTLASLLFTIPVAATQSLFAEGSHVEGHEREHTLRALKLTFLILIPGIIILSLAGPVVLSLFGHNYVADSIPLLILLAVSAVPVALNSVARTILKLRYQSASLVWVSLVGSLIIVGLCFPFQGMGLTGIGVAWLLGQMVMLLCYGLTIRESRALIVGVPWRRRLQAQ
jgi:O-antigen/teichoic acid export membrane protein